MATAGVKKITVSLPPEVVSDLDFIALRMRISRSALLGGVLSECIPGLLAVARCVPASGEVGAEDVRRARGASAEIIGEQIKVLLAGGGDDLFSGQ